MSKDQNLTKVTWSSCSVRGLLLMVPVSQCQARVAGVWPVLPGPLSPHSGSGARDSGCDSGVSGSGSGRVLREAAVSGRSQAVRATRLRSDTWAVSSVNIRNKSQSDNQVKQSSTCVKRPKTLNVSYLKANMSSSF